MDYSKCVESSATDPIYFVKQNPDPHQSQKPDLDLHQSHQELCMLKKWSHRGLHVEACIGGVEAENGAC
jgi:hypothetical protein